jgi:hypothetical protein
VLFDFGELVEPCLRGEFLRLSYLAPLSSLLSPQSALLNPRSSLLAPAVAVAKTLGTIHYKSAMLIRATWQTFFGNLMIYAATASGVLSFGASSLLKNAIVTFFNLAKLAAKLLAARKITTYVVNLRSHLCDHAAS